MTHKHPDLSADIHLDRTIHNDFLDQDVFLVCARLRGRSRTLIWFLLLNGRWQPSYFRQALNFGAVVLPMGRSMFTFYARARAAIWLEARVGHVRVEKYPLTYWVRIHDYTDPPWWAAWRKDYLSRT